MVVVGVWLGERGRNWLGGGREAHTVHGYRPAGVCIRLLPGPPLSHCRAHEFCSPGRNRPLPRRCMSRSKNAFRMGVLTTPHAGMHASNIPCATCAGLIVQAHACDLLRPAQHLHCPCMRRLTSLILASYAIASETRSLLGSAKAMLVPLSPSGTISPMAADELARQGASYGCLRLARSRG